MMTSRPTAPACAAVADLMVGEAMDALEASERLELQRHLVACPLCARELDELRGAAGALSLALPQLEPPPELRDRILAAAQRERPAPAAPRRASSVLRLVPRRAAPQWAGVAAALVVSAGTLAWAASLQAQMVALTQQAEVDRQKAARYDTIVRVLGSTQLTVRPLAAATGGVGASGTIYLDPDSGSGMVMVHDLPPLPPERTWQLWFVRGSERQSGGLLRVDESGTGYTLIRVPADLHAYDSVGITQEPKSGSLAPTSPRVVGGSL